MPRPPWPPWLPQKNDESSLLCTTDAVLTLPTERWGSRGGHQIKCDVAYQKYILLPARNILPT